MLARNAQKVRNLSLGLAGRRNHFVAQQCAGMRWAPIPVALGDMNHDYFSSVTLLELDTASIAVVELEGDASWCHLHGPNSAWA
jgi:hypothetical protein